MPRKIIYDNLNAEIIDTRKLFEDLKVKKFNGYILINKWDGEIYCIVKNGTPVKAVSFDQKGRKEFSECKNIPKENSTISVIETDLLQLIHISHDIPSIQFAGPSVLAGYGTVVQHPVMLTHINLESVLNMIKEERISGYAVFFDEEEITGIFIFYEGNMINAFSKGLFGKEAVNFITKKINSGVYYTAVFSVEPELLLFIHSLDRLGRIQKGTIASFEDLQKLISSASKDRSSFILEAILNNDIRYYFFFFHGSLIKGIKADKGVFEDATVRDLGELMKEGISFSIIHINVDMNPSSVDADIKTGKKDVLEKEKMMEIKNAFIECIGPVGNFLWKKILSEYGISEEEAPREVVESLIKSLFAEIPDNAYAQKFINKTRGILE